MYPVYIHIYIFIFIYIHIHTVTKDLWEPHFVNEAAVKKEGNKLKKVKHGVDRSSCTNITNTRANTIIIIITEYNTTTHPRTHTHESYVLANIFKTRGTTVCHTHCMESYTSQCYLLYLYIQKPYIYDLKIKSRETIASLPATKIKMESLSRIMTCMKSL